MKARIKATGEIIEISGYNYLYAENHEESYTLNEVEFLDVQEKSLLNEPDYWDKLLHRYAGMAMQGMLSNCEFPAYSTDGYHKENIADNALEYATALVNKLKEE